MARQEPKFIFIPVSRCVLAYLQVVLRVAGDSDVVVINEELYAQVIY